MFHAEIGLTLQLLVQVFLKIGTMKKDKFSILYVDDEEINLRVFRSTFEDEFDVFTATSGDEGIEIFKQNDIDLIITDQRMPEMSGVEFLKQIIDLNPEPNRILLTGFSDIDALSSAVNEGKIYQYINKPWDESELKPVIYQALESYYIKKENQRLTNTLQSKNEMLEAEMAAKVALLNQLKLSEHELRIAKEKAEESDLLKTSFLNNMSHEIRTPLNGIVGFAELLCMDEYTTDEKLEFYKFIDQNSKDLLSMISNIILLSQLETGLIKARPEIVNCKQLINSLLKKYDSKLQDKQCRLKLDCQLNDQEALIRTDVLKLSEIISQLLDNAIKFTDEGQIDVKVSKENDRLIISVKDTGIGIDARFHEVIFDRFRKIELNRNKLYRGNGLGLSIAKSYVTLLDGNITLKSVTGKGTEFVLDLPYETASAVEQPKQQQTKLIKGAKILLVEDEPDNISLIRSIVKHENIELVVATNGLQAVELCRQLPDLDLVLMDIRIPELDGFDATRQIKKINPELPVIAQTAYAFEDDIEKAKLSGCDEFIVKPITREKILKYFAI